MDSINFQSESKKSGDDFESLVFQDLNNRGLVNIKKNVYMAHTGCEVDFVAYDSKYDLVEYVEAKGGLDGDGKRPGAKRTDNVKKAIANGALIQTVDIGAYYVVYFSAEPNEGYATEMIDTALKHDIIDEVRYLLPAKLDF